MPSRFAAVLGAIALSLCCFAASAQTTRSATPAFRGPPPADTTACPPPRPEDCRKAKEEEERVERGNELSSPQLVGDAPLPPQGQPNPVPPRIDRGPLKVQRYEASLGLDHALSRQWVLGGLLGVSHGKLQRHQVEFAADAPADPGQDSDTTVRSNSTTLAATLSYFPQPSVFVDGTLSVMSTRFKVKRVVNDAAEFNGDNDGRSIGASLSGGKVWRSGTRALVSQVGLDYVDSHVDALHTVYGFYDSPGLQDEGFSVTEQRQKTLAAIFGVQLQWPQSTSIGTATPYVRGTLRERLWMKADDVIASAPGADDRLLDPEATNSRRSLALGGGAVFQFSHGISAFADLSYARGAGDLRETRLGVGLKFER